jgi:hypothetical protein
VREGTGAAANGPAPSTHYSQVRQHLALASGMEPMMPNDPTRRSALSVALLAHANSGYEVDCWMAGNGQANGSVRYDSDRAWFTIQGRPAALRELAEALVRCADLTEQTYPAPSAPVVEEVAG